MSSPHGPNEFWYAQLQSQLDRRFQEVTKDLDRRFAEMDRRFTSQDGDISEIKSDVKKLKEAPRDNFRTYITPILVAVATAIVLTILIKNGVVSSS